MLENFKRTSKTLRNTANNVITFSGERKGMSEEEGLDNSVIVLKEAARIAEDAGVTICMGCSTARSIIPIICAITVPGHRTLQAGGLSPLQTALRYLPYADHGGRCGENDSRQSQFLRPLPHCRNLLPRCQQVSPRHRSAAGADYVPVMAIAQTGYEGYVAHEFVPKNGMDSLRHAYELCNI